MKKSNYIYFRPREAVLITVKTIYSLLKSRLFGSLQPINRLRINKLAVTEFISYSLLMISIIHLQACSRHENKAGEHTVVIESRANTNTLFYTGTIQPLKTLVIPSPADGVVVDMPFQYGEAVKSGQLLFKVSSAKFLSDYKSALLQYIKTKSDFNNSQTQLSEAEFLHKNQLISDDDFKMKKSNYYAAQLALLQAKDSLEVLLKQLDIKNINLYNLTIADIDKITQAMHLQINSENLNILSPKDGIIISPNKNEDENKKTAKGDVVKQGDLLAMIGDMSGISVRIKVNELTVNELHVGQKVKISGIAFPDHILNGSIIRVDRQGDTTSGGQPTFNVEVNAEHLTAIQQKNINVGMTAKVEIDIQDQPKIMIPIAAVKEKNGESFVSVLDSKTKKLSEVAVKTGKTTIDSVTILSGLKTGDSLVIPD